MSAANSFPAQHQHVFLGSEHDRHERRTWLVVGLTTVMMVAEIVAGTVFGSMALMADGWHMSTHAAALGIAAFAYRFARQHAHDRRFSFGTGKLGDLAAVLRRAGIQLIAERVEREEIVPDLIDLDVPLAQGFVFAPPRVVRSEVFHAQSVAKVAEDAAEMPMAEPSVSVAVQGSPAPESEERKPFRAFLRRAV